MNKIQLFFILFASLLISSCGSDCSGFFKDLQKNVVGTRCVPANSTITTSVDYGCGASCNSDCKMWMIGGQASGQTETNTIWSSSDGVNWSSAGTLPAGHMSASALVFAGKMWLIGGDYGIVWSSADGASWTSVGTLPANSFPGGAYVSFNGKMWAIGGGANSSGHVGVWSSSNGVTWSAEADLPIALVRHVAVVFKNKIFVLGGLYNLNPISSIYSTTGASWSNPGTLPENWVDSNPPIIFNSNVWLLGANGTRSVLNSSDGQNWNNVGTMPTGHNGMWGVIQYKNKIFSAGGYDNGTVLSEVLSSSDGANWTSIGTLPSPRFAAPLITFSPQCGTGAN